MNEHLKRFGLKEDVSLDDIKKKYRVLSKKYHPDLNPGIDAKLFVELSISYEWLIKNHEPSMGLSMEDLMNDYKPYVYRPQQKDNKAAPQWRPYKPNLADHPNPAIKKHGERLKQPHYEFKRNIADQRGYNRNGQQDAKISIPIKILDKDVLIYIMLSPDTEMFMWIDKGKTLPYTYKEAVGTEIYNFTVDYNDKVV